MRHRTLFAFALALAACAPATTYGQNRESKQAERQISASLDEFNKEMRGYERELKYFEKVAEFATLKELRDDLVKQAFEMNVLDKKGPGNGPAILTLAKEMDANARKLHAQTTELEKRAEKVSNREGVSVASRMKANSESMVKSVDEMLKLFSR